MSGDGRGALIVLTAAGRAAIESAAPRHAAAVRQLAFGPLDDSQTAVLGQAFIAAALEDVSTQRPGRPKQ